MRVRTDGRVDISNVHKSRWSHKCYLCKRKQGCIVACGMPKCRKFFHPLCALLDAGEGAPFLGVGADGQACFFCHQHIPPGYKRDELGQWVKIPPPFHIVAMRELNQSLCQLRALAFLCRRRDKVKNRVSLS